MYLLERKIRLDAGDAGNAYQMVENEAFVSGQIRDHDMKQIVETSGHKIALQHLRTLQHRAFEGLPAGFDLFSKVILTNT